jgi:hypothetical protein
MLLSIFSDLSATGSGLIFVIASVVFSLLGLLIFKKITEKEHIKRSSESFVALVSIIAILYAVLLAFIVIVAWEGYDNAGNNVDDEANSISTVFRDAGLLKDTVKARLLQKDLMQYNKLIATKEWHTMQTGDVFMGHKIKAAKELFPVVRSMMKTLKEYETEDTKDDVVFTDVLQNFNKMQECRRIRLLNAGKEIPVVLWLVILAGTIITLIFTFFFHFENFFTKAIFTSLIAIMMALTMFLIYYLNHPFKDGGVTPEPFEINHTIFSSTLK